MSSAEEQVMQWLRDAHAMEKQAEQMLSGLASRTGDYPEVQAAVKRHLRETEDQALQLEKLIDSKGSGTSTMKDTGGKLMAMAQSVSGMFVEDEIIKGYMASYTFEQMEIVSYRTLIAAAETLGDREIARVCKGILAQEEATAKWLMDHLDGTVAKYLKIAERDAA